MIHNNIHHSPRLSPAQCSLNSAESWHETSIIHSFCYYCFFTTWAVFFLQDNLTMRSNKAKRRVGEYVGQILNCAKQWILHLIYGDMALFGGECFCQVNCLSLLQEVMMTSRRHHPKSHCVYGEILYQYIAHDIHKLLYRESFLFLYHVI